MQLNHLCSFEQRMILGREMGRTGSDPPCNVVAQETQVPRVFEIERSESGWLLKARGEVLSSHPHQSTALAEGLRLARSNEPSTLIVKRAAGGIETERTFGHPRFAGSRRSG